MLLFSKLDMPSLVYDQVAVPHRRSSLDNRILLELFSEPDIFGFQWASTNVYNGVTYPALPDLYGPTMNVRSSSPPPLWISRVLRTYSPMSEVCAPRYLAGLVSTHG